jgi:hypothetical protein
MTKFVQPCSFHSVLLVTIKHASCDYRNTIFIGRCPWQLLLQAWHLQQRQQQQHTEAQAVTSRCTLTPLTQQQQQQWQQQQPQVVRMGTLLLQQLASQVPISTSQQTGRVTCPTVKQQTQHSLQLDGSQQSAARVTAWTCSLTCY